MNIDELRKNGFIIHHLLLEAGFHIDEKTANHRTKIYTDSSSNEKGSRKIAVTGVKFIDNYDTSFCGSGAIDLQMLLKFNRKDKSLYKDTIKLLVEKFTDEEITNHITNPYILQTDIVKKAVSTMINSHERNILSPVHVKSKESQAKSFLLRRGITIDTIDFLFKSQQIIVDGYGNIILKRETGGYFARGTYKDTDFKRTVGDKSKGAAYIYGKDCEDTIEKTIVCESITDAIALVHLYNDAKIAVIGGSMHPEIAVEGQLFLAFDNDDAGRCHYRYYKEVYTSAQRLSPPAEKDWSDYVKNRTRIDSKQRFDDDHDDDESRLEMRLS